MIAFSVEMPGTSEAFCFRVNSFSVALNWFEILSYNIKNKSNYPILTIKYRNTNVSSIIPIKKKTCKNLRHIYRI